MVEELHQEEKWVGVEECREGCNLHARRRPTRAVLVQNVVQDVIVLIQLVFQTVVLVEEEKWHVVEKLGEENFILEAI